MKLQNKKTGKIGYTAVLQSKAIVVMDENAIQLGSYTSLAELNEDWEDYEEPKDYWYLNCDGSVIRAVYKSDDLKRCLIAIGNYFETPEEAEKAVEKLEAWKRLKDNGFKFQFWTSTYSGDNISFFIDWINADSKKEIEKDLDLLFGGEE